MRVCRVGSLVASDGTRLVFSDNGEGPPTLLLHGLACTREVWTEVTELLTPRRRVVAVDLRGHGESTPVVGTFSLDQQADDINALLIELDLRDVVLVGHSAGGYSALAFVERFPDVARQRVRRIVTIGTSPSLLGARERFVLRVSASRIFYALLAIAPIGRLLVRSGAFGDNPSAAAVETTRQMALACDRSTKVSWVRAIAGTSLPLPNSPSLIAATGERDATVTPKRLKALAATSNAATSVVPGAGHMAPLEAPIDVARLITTP